MVWKYKWILPKNILTSSRMDIFSTAWKVSKCGVFSGRHFPLFRPEKTPYFDTFHTVFPSYISPLKIVSKNKNDAYVAFISFMFVKIQKMYYLEHR